MGLLESISGIFGKKEEKKKQVQIQVKKPRQKQQKRTKEQLILSDWKNELERLTQHPLTQAKLINEKLLQDLYIVLEQINNKLNVLNTKLDKAGLERVEPKTSQQRSSQEQKILDLIDKRDRLMAADITKVLNISRSNASLKLNKLYDMGLLEKEQEGKEVFYKLKQIKNSNL